MRSILGPESLDFFLASTGACTAGIRDCLLFLFISFGNEQLSWDSSGDQIVYSPENAF